MTPPDEDRLIRVRQLKSSGTGPGRSHDRLRAWPSVPAEESALFASLRELCEEGITISDRLKSGRGDVWHSFEPAGYGVVLQALLNVRESGGRFLELGSAIGVIAIMADLLGFEAFGIEIDAELVSEARDLAARYGSGARFATGSYVPSGYQFVSEHGDTRMGAVGLAEPAYPELGHELADFDWVYAYPWPGEEEVVRDLMRRCGAGHAKLLLLS